MIDKARFQIGRAQRCGPGWIIGLAFVALLITAWLTAPVDLTAVAAEVDAIGAPAPIGFADIVERVKSAVVGVRVKIEEQHIGPGSKKGTTFSRFPV